MGGEELRFVRESFESNYIAPLGPMVDAYAFYKGCGVWRMAQAIRKKGKSKDALLSFNSIVWEGACGEGDYWLYRDYVK